MIVRRMPVQPVIIKELGMGQNAPVIQVGGAVIARKTILVAGMGVGLADVYAIDLGAERIVPWKMPVAITEIGTIAVVDSAVAIPVGAAVIVLYCNKKHIQKSVRRMSDAFVRNKPKLFRFGFFGLVGFVSLGFFGCFLFGRLVFGIGFGCLFGFLGQSSTQNITQ